MASNASRAVEQQTSRPIDAGLRILAVIDGSERSGRIVDYALGLKKMAHGLRVVVLGVVPEPATGRLRGYGTFMQAEVYKGLIDNMRQRAVSAVARRLDQEGISHIDRVEVGDPVTTILRVAREERADQILLGEGPAGVAQRILPAIGLALATVTNRVVQRAKVPVVIVK